MLRDHRIGLELALVAFAPDRLKALRAQAGQKLCPRRPGDTMGRIQIIFLPQKTTMIGRVPVLARVNARPASRQQAIDLRHDFQAARHGKFARTKRRESLLDVYHQQRASTQLNRLHASPLLGKNPALRMLYGI